MMLVLATTAVFFLWFSFLVIRVPFLDTMVAVQQYRMLRLLLSMEQAAAAGHIDSTTPWFKSRVHAFTVFAEVPTWMMPGLVTLMWASFGPGKTVKTTRAITEIERDFELKYVAIAIRMLGYRSVALWGLLKAGQGLLGVATIARSVALWVDRWSNKQTQLLPRGPDGTLAHS
ncbi:MAG: hypothetical protein ABMA64_08705 [Myxococcota bacterium]